MTAGCRVINRIGRTFAIVHDLMINTADQLNRLLMRRFERHGWVTSVGLLIILHIAAAGYSLRPVRLVILRNRRSSRPDDLALYRAGNDVNQILVILI